MEITENNIDGGKERIEKAQVINENRNENIIVTDPDMMCGIGRWQPKFLQCFANIKFVFFLFCAANFLLSFSYSVFIATITSIQKRYALPSLFFGLNATLFDSAILLSVLFVAYLGGRHGSHRPRWVGIGLVLAAISSSSISLNHFMSSPYEYGKLDLKSNITTLCSEDYDYMKVNRSLTDCSSDSARAAESDSVRMAVMMLLGHTLAGICYTPFIVLTPTYLDDFIGKKKSPLYLGIFYAMYSLGAVVGFPFSSIFVSIYVDVGRVDLTTVDLTPDDARWVGAWWLGFIVDGILTLMVAIPLVFAPKKLALSTNKLNDVKQERKHEISLQNNDGDDDENAVGQEALKRIKEFPKALGRLFTNLSLISIAIAYGLEVAMISGLVTFATKYTEVQFRISATMSANITGVGLVISSTIGTLLGGYFLRRFKPDLVTTVKYVVIIAIFNVFLPIPLLFLGCNNEEFAGVTIPYQKYNVTVNDTWESEDLWPDSPLVSPCNIYCDCADSRYDPVCGNDGITYFSSCFAGCTETTTHKNFSSCSCINPGTSVLSEQTAQIGICGGQCTSMLILFIVVIFVESLVASLPLTAFVIITFRCVAPADKPFALGIRQLFAQVLGWVPTPIYMGIIIDSTCLLWSQNQCSEFSTCWQYDLFDYRYKLFTFQIVLKILALLMYTICWQSLKRKKEKGTLH
uniref:Solute carrier organic anion transporter family member n=1 Tax=Saccoglossus kowalevskii TaxID=10224 RepID=A0ABM0LW03_SACKO|nr:PREDICTED: solute carrier organic anion transporter family member 1B3-like [Saccoglossus kowalevskii]